jgi:hypothetical protein
MKRKTKASSKSMSPSNIAAGLVPEPAAIIKINKRTLMGKHKAKIETNGINHNDLGR